MILRFVTISLSQIEFWPIICLSLYLSPLRARSTALQRAFKLTQDLFYALRLAVMPATPLHFSIAYLINRWRPQLSLPALLVGTMVPDIEIPFTYLLTGGAHGRIVLHSFLGAATMGTILSVLLTVFFYPPVISFFFKLDKEKVEEKCRFSGTLVILCLSGILSHVFIDSLHHEFNPVLYPFVKETFDALMFTNDPTFATVVVTSVLLVPLILLFVLEIRKGIRDFWMRMLVG